MGIVGNLTPAQLDFFNSQGYLVIESFASPGEIDAMRKRMGQLLEVFDPSATASIFSTKSQLHLTTDYFYESAEKISFFFEEKAFGDDGKLKQSKELSINKFGHGMQPGIGGEISPHQDNSFLYTDLARAFWLVLEDATIKNGCLWAIPGSYKNGLVQRTIRGEDRVSFDRPSPSHDQKDFVPILIVICGDLIHQSFQNNSPRSRHAYSLHVVDTDGCKWLEDNSRKVEPEPLSVS